MPKFEVQRYILQELPAIQESAPIESLLDGLIEHGIISSEESKTMRGERGMQRLYSKLRRRNFKTFILFVKCILEAGEKDSSVNTCIVNSIRGVAASYDEMHQTNYTQKIPQKKYTLVFESEDSEDDQRSSVTSGYVSNATSSAFSTPASSFDDPTEEPEAASDQTPVVMFEHNTVPELLRDRSRVVATASQSDDEKGKTANKIQNLPCDSLGNKPACALSLVTVYRTGHHVHTRSCEQASLSPGPVTDKPACALTP